jgi:hypothetical protein
MECLASKQSMVAKHLIQALAMRLKTNHTCPLTPMHIPGHQKIADVPSCSFESHPALHCVTDSDVLTLFNSMFPLPNQQLWTVFHSNYEVAMRMISALQMQPFELYGWRQLPKVGKHLAKLVCLRPAFGSGSIHATHPFPNPRQMPHRLCCPHKNMFLRPGMKGTK